MPTSLGGCENLRKQSNPALSPGDWTHPERPFSNFHQGAYSLAHGPGLEQWMTDPQVPTEKTRSRSKADPFPRASPAPPLMSPTVDV